MGDKYGENLGKYCRGISENLGKILGGKLCEISVKCRANLVEIGMEI